MLWSNFCLNAVLEAGTVALPEDAEGGLYA